MPANTVNDLSTALSDIVIDGTEYAPDQCDGIVVYPTTSDESEFYWLSTTEDDDQFQVIYPSPGPSVTLHPQTVVDLLEAGACTLAVHDDSGGVRTSDSNPARHRPQDQRYRVRITGPLETELVYGRDDPETVLRDVVNYLIREHDLITAIGQLPWVADSENAVLNETPTRSDGSDMEQYVELTDNHYLDTDVADATEILRRLCDEVSSDLSSEFEGAW